MIEAAQKIGLLPKRVSSTKGGKSKSPCPLCGGKDRFRIQPHSNNGRGQYFCRQCRIHGDAIAFVREFLGLNFCEARQYVGFSGSENYLSFDGGPAVKSPKVDWVEKVEEFVEGACGRLIIDPYALKFVETKYGIEMDTIRRFRLGWNTQQRFDRRSDWGLEESENKIWISLPSGVVIPSFYGGEVSRVKIRRFRVSTGEFRQPDTRS